MFPAEHFGSLYGLLTAPGIVTMWFIDPLFRVILGGEEIADADFAPVSIGFAVICAVCLLQVFLPKFGLIPAAIKMSSEKTAINESGVSNGAFEEKENMEKETDNSPVSQL